jgi:hypothetical protein
MIEGVAAEPFGLQSIVAMRQTRIGFTHRRNQGVDDLRLDPVGEMTRRRHVLEAAPTIGDLLVLGQRVGDVGEQTEIRLESRRQRLGGGLTLRRIGILHQIQRRLDGEFLAAD